MPNPDQFVEYHFDKQQFLDARVDRLDPSFSLRQSSRQQFFAYSEDLAPKISPVYARQNEIVARGEAHNIPIHELRLSQAENPDTKFRAFQVGPDPLLELLLLTHPKQNQLSWHSQEITPNRNTYEEIPFVDVPRILHPQVPLLPTKEEIIWRSKARLTNKNMDSQEYYLNVPPQKLVYEQRVAYDPDLFSVEYVVNYNPNLQFSLTIQKADQGSPAQLVLIRHPQETYNPETINWILHHHRNWNEQIYGDRPYAANMANAVNALIAPDP